MKFLLEDSNHITICKYSKDDLVLREKGIFIVGIDKTAAQLRVPPLNNAKHFVSKSQLAEFDEYIYLPEDQLSKIFTDSLYKFPKPKAKKVLSKLEWKNIKERHPYKGA